MHTHSTRRELGLERAIRGLGKKLGDRFQADRVADELLRRQEEAVELEKADLSSLRKGLRSGPRQRSLLEAARSVTEVLLANGTDREEPRLRGQKRIRSENSDLG